MQVASAVTALTGIIYESITAYGEHEQAIMRLDTALKNQGNATVGAGKRLEELASHLQKTTGVNDTTIVSFQGLLATMGFNEAAIREMTPRILNLSRAMGIDASTAALSLGKSLENGTGMSLKRLGLTLDESKFKTRDFAGIMGELDKKTGGMANKFGNTTLGSLSKFRNAIDDLMKSIGALESGPLKRLLDGLTKLTENSIAAINGGFGSLVDRIRGSKDEITAMLGLGMTGPAGPTGVVGPSGGGGVPIIPTSPAQRENESFEQEATTRKILDLQNRHSEVERLEIEHQAKLLEISKRSSEAEHLRAAFYHKQKVTMAKAAFDQLAGLSNSKTKELALIGKAAGIATATIAGSVAIQEALAGPPGPPWTFALAAATAAMTAANIATIAGVKLAGGGMVLPTGGGTLATIGEAGSREAVIPLDDPKTREALGETLGGGVHIHVGTMIANQQGVEQLALLIDKELWRLRKNRSAVSF